jgi:hypothetical protein
MQLEKKIILLVLSGICCLNILPAQIPKKNPPSEFERVLNKNISYPDVLVDSISGYVVGEVYREENGSILFMDLYSRHPDFSAAVFATLHKIPTKDWEKFEYIFNKPILFEFITYTYPDKKLIPHTEVKTLLDSLGVNENTLSIKTESWTICKKYSIAPSMPAQPQKEIPKKPQ